MNIQEVGPMDGDMAYDRGYIQVLNAEQNVMINGKYVYIYVIVYYSNNIIIMYTI